MMLKRVSRQARELMIAMLIEVVALIMMMVLAVRGGCHSVPFVGFRIC